MKPYATLKLTECPDVGDIQGEGRKSVVGRVKRGEEFQRINRRGQLTPVKVIHNDHGYTRKANNKARVRRTLKRADKARVAQEEL